MSRFDAYAAAPAAKPAPADPRSDLDRAVEALVAAHTRGAVIDAAWAAAQRLFRPMPRA